MSTPLSPLGLLVACLVAVGVFVAATWLLSKWWYSRQIAALQGKARKHDQAHSALQAKHQGLMAQLDTLRAELRSQKALALSLSERVNERGAKAVAPPATPAVVALNEPFINPRGPKRPPDFEDTQIL